jgi:hypothetical protein
MSEKKHQSWNFWSAFVFFGMVALFGFLFERKGIDIREMGLKEALIIILASYRLTRVLVFEKIFKYFRDVVKSRSHLYIIGTISSIITCPWCAGVWMTLVITVFYFLVPYGYLLCIVLALAGIASLFTILSNMMQMNAEMKQREHHKQREEGGPVH